MLLHTSEAEAPRQLPELPDFSRFRRIVLPGNPYGTNFTRAITAGERVIARLEGQMEQIESFVTVPGGYDANRAVFDKYNEMLLAEDTLALSQMGDGGLRMLMQWMAQNKSLATLMALGGGNACDFTNVTLGGVDPDTVVHNMPKLRQRPFFPLICRVTDPQGHKTEYVGHSNWSTGISHHVADALNQDRIRKHPFALAHKTGKFALETTVTLLAAATSKPFRITIDPARGPQLLRELLVSNIPIMAKVGRLAVVTHAPEAFLTAIDNNTHNPLSSGYLIRRLTNGTMDGVTLRTERLAPDDGHEHTIPFAVFDALHDMGAQMDGDTMHITKGSKIELEHGAYPLRVMSLAA